MENQTAPPGAFPPAWRDRCWTHVQTAHITAVPPDTLYSWSRLARAMGLRLGKKYGVEWRFDCHELYFFRMLAALMHLRLPVSAEMLRAVYDFAFDDDGQPVAPVSKFRASTTDGAASVTIDAPRIFNAVATAAEPADA